eukprot:285703-Alexandrium_andersonii.AAC.1
MKRGGWRPSQFRGKGRGRDGGPRPAAGSVPLGLGSSASSSGGVVSGPPAERPGHHSHLVERCLELYALGLISATSA